MKKLIVLMLLILASSAILISQVTMTGGGGTSSYTITNNADGTTIEDSSGFLRIKPDASPYYNFVGTNGAGTVVWAYVDSNYVPTGRLSITDIRPAGAAYYVLVTDNNSMEWVRLDSNYIENLSIANEDMKYGYITFQTGRGIKMNNDPVDNKVIWLGDTIRVELLYNSTLELVNDSLGVVTLTNIDPETQITAAGGNTYEVLMDNGALAIWAMIDSMSLNSSSVKTAELASNAVTAVKVTDSTLTSQKTATATFTSFHHFDTDVWGRGLYLEKVDGSHWLPGIAVKAPIINTSDSLRLSYDGTSLDTSAGGALQVNAIYAFLKQDDDTTTVTVTTAGTYYDLETWEGGYESSGMTTDVGEPIGGWIRCNTAGIYKVDAAFSFYGTASAVYDVVLFKGAVAQDQISFTRKLGAGGDVGSASCHGIITLAVADTLRFKVTSDDNGDTFSFSRSQFAVHLIGM